jgi:hypothetical protein
MRKIALALFVLVAIAAPARAQDCKPYFFNLIQRSEGQPAPDWKQVVEDLHYVKGVPKNPQPGDRGIGAPFNGLTVMIDAGGNARGRVWFYTDVPSTTDGNTWYTHEYQYIADGPTPGSFVWAWKDLAGGPPRPCGGSPAPPVITPPVTPPAPPVVSPDLVARIAALEEQLSSLRGDFDAWKAPTAISTDDILKALGEGVRFDCSIGRTGAGFLSHGHGCTVTAVKK